MVIVGLVRGVSICYYILSSLPLLLDACGNTPTMTSVRGIQAELHLERH